MTLLKSDSTEMVNAILELAQLKDDDLASVLGRMPKPLANRLHERLIQTTPDFDTSIPIRGNDLQEMALCFGIDGRRMKSDNVGEERGFFDNWPAGACATLMIGMSQFERVRVASGFPSSKLRKIAELVVAVAPGRMASSSSKLKEIVDSRNLLVPDSPTQVKGDPKGASILAKRSPPVKNILGWVKSWLNG